MTLKLNGSTSGSVSIDAPASTTSGADITFKLPVADGTNGQALTTNASGQLAFAAVGGGKVLQYVYETANTDVTTSGGSENEVIDATITPASASNKILVMGFVLLDIDNSGSAYADVKLYRGSSSGTEIQRAIAGNSTAANIVHAVTPWMVDSPNTTSAQEYTITISRGSGTTSQVSTSGATNYNLLLVELEG
jgi:hypothetical protein